MGFKHLAAIAAIVALAAQPWPATAAVDLELNVAAMTGGELDSDWANIYYSETGPLLLGNDGGAATGGFHVWDVDGDSPLSDKIKTLATGRTKLVTTVYNVTGKDLAITIAMPDSVIRVLEMPSFSEIEFAQTTLLGDWSAICAWRSTSFDDYVFFFGKEKAVQYLVREGRSGVELVEVQTFAVPTEFSGCAVSQSQSKMILSADDDKDLYFFNLTESATAPEVAKLGEAAEDVTGVAIYASNSTYMFVAQENVIAAYEYPFKLIGTIKLIGMEDIEIQGLSTFQGSTVKYPKGVLAFAIEADDVAGFGLVSLEDALDKLGVASNVKYDPRAQAGGQTPSKICDACSGNGYCQCHDGAAICSCFAGFTGEKCDAFQCADNCSGRGQCIGPNRCECESGWGGLHCSFLLAEPAYETDPNGADGDDPAIWISPESPDKSRIITTTKSTEGAGLGVFDLTGKLLQTIYAGEPNNVDMIYGFQAGNRTVDLAFAACRTDDTLCLFEMTSNGTLKNIPGGIQPVVPDYTVYGSCVYRSPKTGKQYLFVNEKSARYLQYELTSTPNGTLQIALVRDFTGGSGGQVEGCVTDEDNGWIFLGEEPSALWRYGAEPDSTEPRVRIAHVGDGRIHADVEGVALVYGAAPDKGYVLVSSQGVSAYTVYRRAAPHEYVTTFTVTASADGRVDAVSNTDGITAVGTSLGGDFPFGLLVVHDDANQLPDGTTSDEASFKLVSLEKVLGAEQLRSLDLLEDVDTTWDPRKH